ncbi:MAG: hypothetical protein IKJ56_11790, partial [Bacteroidales bacterium]|nr:hypothetical protein [Bacteroidales bacterium]
KLFLLVLVIFLCSGAFSQEITLSFIGQLNNSEYCPMDSVVVTNVTRNWTESVVYPDTIIVVGGTVGNNLNIVTNMGLEQNVPNPFDCETRVELAVLHREDVRMQLLDVAGHVCAEYTGSLNEGVHVFDISAANPQTYILNAIIGNRSYSIRMVNVGSGCGCSIKYSGLGKNIVQKFETTNEFELGDDMRFVGYATIEGDMLASDTVEQSLSESQCVTLHFTRSLPHVETLAASSVTNLSAILHGRITSTGGSSIIACGFYYGTSEDDLSQNVAAILTDSMFSYELTGLTTGTTYYYKAYAINSEDTTYGEVMSFTTEIVYTSYSNPTGYTDGYGYVDLGLPSGTKWATCNVGASTPIRYGNYYAWGETATNELYGSGSYTYSDSPAVLPASADVATASWGEGWRMPTKEEFQELNICCTVTWTTMNGVNGRLFTGPNGNSIFLPAAGCRLVSSLYNAGSSGDYWSSSLYMGDTTRAWGLYFGRGNSDMNYYSDRYYGLTVRPICVSASSTAVAPTVTTTFASNVTAMGATLSGNVTSDGGVTVFACGFLYGTDTNNLTQSVQSGSGTGSFTANITGLADGTTYYYKAYAVNVVGTAYGNTMSFTTETIPTLYSDPTGYTDGYGYVDLGLPSGLLWATCNVGANNPEDYGDYFAWGETTTKETYNWSTYRYCTGSGDLNTLTKYCFTSYYGYQGFTDTLTTLEAIDDAAIANWGTGWRMPTQDEMYELIDNCDTTWTALNGINGMLITSRTNGNTIFLPAAGCRSDDSSDGVGSYGGYWSSSLRTDIMNNPQSAWDLHFNPYYYYMWSVARSYGLSVRPVCSQ